MTKKEDILLNKLIAAAGWLTRAYNKYQLYQRYNNSLDSDLAKMVVAMRTANSVIDEAIEILKEPNGRPKP